MKRQTLYPVAMIVVLVGFTAFMVSLLLKSDAPEIAYFMAPVGWCALVSVVILAVLLNRDRRAGRPEQLRIDWSGTAALAYALAYAGGLISALTIASAGIERETSRLVLMELGLTLGLFAMNWGMTILSNPRRAGHALLVVGGLLIVLAATVPLFDLQGPEWVATGFHAAYFFIAVGGARPGCRARRSAGGEGGGRPAGAAGIERGGFMNRRILNRLIAVVVFVGRGRVPVQPLPQGDNARRGLLVAARR